MWAAAGREVWSPVLQPSVREQLPPRDLGFCGREGVAASCKKDSGERVLGIGECACTCGGRDTDGFGLHAGSESREVDNKIITRAEPWDVGC